MFWPKRKYEKCGNTGCISHFSYCTIGAKDPLKPVAPIVRCCPYTNSRAALCCPGILLQIFPDPFDQSGIFFLCQVFSSGVHGKGCAPLERVLIPGDLSFENLLSVSDIPVIAQKLCPVKEAQPSFSLLSQRSIHNCFTISVRFTMVIPEKGWYYYTSLFRIKVSIRRAPCPGRKCDWK